MKQQTWSTYLLKMTQIFNKHWNSKMSFEILSNPKFVVDEWREEYSKGDDFILVWCLQSKKYSSNYFFSRIEGKAHWSLPGHCFIYSASFSASISNLLYLPKTFRCKTIDLRSFPLIEMISSDFSSKKTRSIEISNLLLPINWKSIDYVRSI